VLYLNWQAPLWEIPNVRKYFDIPPGALVEPLADGDGLTLVRFRGFEGWVENRFLDEYERNLPADVVDLSDIETSDPHDLGQYVNWKGQRQVNMCGEICAAYVFEVRLSDVLIHWEAKKPVFFWRVFRGGKAAGTNADDLIALFELYGTEAKKLKVWRYTPTYFRDLCEEQYLICGVKMHSSGELRSGSIRHWVVLKSVTIERKRMGYVTVFNPANNCDEWYSWAEWVAAAGVPYGVTVDKFI
jgi:hypothetical protein